MSLELAQQYGTPLYVYDFETVVERYRQLVNAFSWRGGLRILFAMKANSNFRLLQLLASLHKRVPDLPPVNVDCVSPGEVLLALHAGFDSSKVLFTANNITDAEMKRVKAKGVLFNVGSLSRLEKFGRAFPGSRVALRFNPDVVAGENAKVQTGGVQSKFGILISDVKDAKRICAKYALKVVGVHEHTGSGIGSPDAILESARNLLTVATRSHFPSLSFVDFGGGFKIPYRPSDKRTPIKEIGTAVIRLLDAQISSSDSPLELCLEPGKWLVGECGTLLTTVTTVKSNKGRLISGTDSGFNHLIRPTLYGAYHHIVNLSRDKDESATYDVCGNICETGDQFAVRRVMPCSIKEGDILAIQTAGAYGMSMASLYNMRSLPAEVIVRSVGGKRVVELVRKRQSDEELVTTHMQTSCLFSSTEQDAPTQVKSASMAARSPYGQMGAEGAVNLPLDRVAEPPKKRRKHRQQK